MFLGEPRELSLQLSHCFEVVAADELLAFFFHERLEFFFRFQELGVLAAMREDDGVIDAGEDYGGTPVDPTQLSALVGAPRLGV